MKVSVIIASILTFLIGTAHIKKFCKCTPTAKKTCFTRQFYFRDEKVIFLDRSRLRALIVFIFAHDMQIQVAHALCKQGCRLISDTANIRLVTIATCYNCPRSPRMDNSASCFDTIDRMDMQPLVYHGKRHPTYTQLCDKHCLGFETAIAGINTGYIDWEFIKQPSQCNSVTQFNGTTRIPSNGNSLPSDKKTPWFSCLTKTRMRLLEEYFRL